MWYLSLLFILFLIIIFTYFVKEYRRYRLELDKTLLEYHSYVVKMDKLEKENIQLRRELAIEKNAAKERKEKVNHTVYGKPVDMYIENVHKNRDLKTAVFKIFRFFGFFNHDDFSIGRG